MIVANRKRRGPHTFVSRSPKEIADACRKIQATWDVFEEHRRRVCRVDPIEVERVSLDGDGLPAAQKLN